MKKLVIGFISILLLTGSSFAQEQQRDRDRDQLRDHLMLKDGKMVQVKEGEEIQLQSQLQLRNGTTVNPDGTYQLKNQKRLQLKDGECLGMDGKKYRTREQFEMRMKNRENRNLKLEKRKKDPNTKQGGKKGKNN